jgi:hypothetical protein
MLLVIILKEYLARFSFNVDAQFRFRNVRVYQAMSLEKLRCISAYQIRSQYANMHLIFSRENKTGPRAWKWPPCTQRENAE